MTYQDDPNFNRPTKDDEPNYVPWTIGGAVALAVIVSIILLSGSRTEKDSTVANNPPAATKMAPAPATTPPATTGSAPATPAAR